MKTTNPYLNARQEWNERYGSYIAQVKAWRLVAILSLLVAAVAVVGAIWLASQSKFVPYIVEVDGQGKVQTAYVSTKGSKNDVRIIKSQIAQFIRDVRSVSSDRAVQVLAIRRAYAHLNDKLPAYRTVNQWFRENVPFERYQAAGTVEVEVQQILPLSEKTWRVEWTETPKARNGIAEKPIGMTGTISVIENGEVTDQTLQHNPVGLFIENFEWSAGYNPNGG